MVSLWRTIRSAQRTGLRAWWRQLQYIGDAKSGTLVGADQYVVNTRLNSPLTLVRFGNRYFENRNGEEEVPGTQAVRHLRCANVL